MSLIGVGEFIILALLPGQWITFGLALPKLPFWARFAGGAVLAPLVICLQFYALRLLGVPFESTVTLLVVLNLPVLILLYRHRRDLVLPDRRTLAGWFLVLIVPFLLLSRLILDPYSRVYTGHSWLYSDPIYMIANGDLLLQDPELVGVRLDYPWAGLIYEGILSYVIGSPPAAAYIWVNLLWLLLISAFAGGIVGELGGNRLSRITSVVWLFFGVNFLGYILEKIIWTVLGRYYPLTGDYRYTPWVFKFLFFEQEPLTLGVFIVLVFLLIRQRSERLAGSSLALIGLLFCELAGLYPLLFPAAAAVIGASALAVLIDHYRAPLVDLVKEIAPLVIVVLAGGLVSFLNVKLLTQDRVTPTWYFDTAWKWKTLATVVVTGPLLIGLGLAFRSCWKERRSATLILILGAIASSILFAIFTIPGFGNEYKFIFTAAICLAPFPALALESLTQRLGKRAIPVYAAILVILAFPLAVKMYTDFPWFESAKLSMEPPPVDVNSFDLRLTPDNPSSAMYDFIRTQTPVDSILVLENAELHLPTLTQRQLFVPPAQSKPHPGVNIVSDDILQISRGYDKQIFVERRLVLDGLFNSKSDDQRSNSLAQILEFNRPVEIVLDKQRNASLLKWLSEEKRGRIVYDGNGVIVWLIQAGQA